MNGARQANVSSVSQNIEKGVVAILRFGGSNCIPVGPVVFSLIGVRLVKSAPPAGKPFRDWIRVLPGFQAVSAIKS
jgi:hypothetical protein